MNRSLLVNFLLILLFFFIGQTIFRLFLPIYQVKLLLLAGLALLFIDYDNKSFWWFLLGGLLLDLVSTKFFGFNTIIFVGIYLLISYLKKTVVHKPNIFLIGLVVAGSIMVYDLSSWLATGGQVFTRFLIIYGGDLLVNLIAIWPVYILFVYLTGLLDRYNLMED